MLRKIRRLPSPALVIASIALILAVGGGSFALAISDKKSDKKIAKKVANKQITKRASGLSVNHANSADNASQLGGVPASGYTQNGCGPLTGQIKGFARIDATTVSNSLSQTGVQIPYNCSGGSVLARRIALGDYEVQFSGSPVQFALATPLFASGQATALTERTVNVRQIAAGDFEVFTNIDTGGKTNDTSFVILTP